MNDLELYLKKKGIVDPRNIHAIASTNSYFKIIGKGFKQVEGYVLISITGDKFNIYDITEDEDIGTQLFTCKLEEINKLRFKSNAFFNIIKFKIGEQNFKFNNYTKTKCFIEPFRTANLL